MGKKIVKLTKFYTPYIVVFDRYFTIYVSMDDVEPILDVKHDTKPAARNLYADFKSKEKIK